MFGFKKKSQLVSLFDKYYGEIQGLLAKEIYVEKSTIAENATWMFQETYYLLYAVAYITAHLFEKDKGIIVARFMEWYASKSGPNVVPFPGDRFTSRVTFYMKIATGELELSAETIPMQIRNTIPQTPQMLWMILAYCDCMLDKEYIENYDKRRNEYYVQINLNKARQILYDSDASETKDDELMDFYKRFTLPLHQFLHSFAEHIQKDKLI